MASLISISIVGGRVFLNVLHVFAYLPYFKFDCENIGQMLNMSEYKTKIQKREKEK